MAVAIAVDALRVMRAAWSLDDMPPEGSKLNGAVAIKSGEPLENGGGLFVTKFTASSGENVIFNVRIAVEVSFGDITFAQVVEREDVRTGLNATLTELTLGQARSMIVMAFGMAGFTAPLIVPTLLNRNWF
ncbi:hypothetical protein ACFQDE_16210 [Deinococcus caeni]|uniref:hypothetical protein n=1 Tax=Deinococcus caeni TaxID=569127 RepID=UPI00360BE66D